MYGVLGFGGLSRFDFQVVNEWPYDFKLTGNSNYYGNNAKLETCHRDPGNLSPKAGKEVLFICSTIEENSSGKWIKFVAYNIDRATLTPSFVQVRHLSEYSNPTDYDFSDPFSLVNDPVRVFQAWDYSTIYVVSGSEETLSKL